MDPNSKNILSIDIGGSKIMVGVVDFNGRIILKSKAFLKKSIAKDYLIKKILDMVESILSKDSFNILCIGVAVPGLADPQKGILTYAPYSGITNLAIGDILMEELDVPVFVENDVNACAYGEMIYGACRYVKNFVWITVSNGVGGALVLDGKVYKGKNNGAGEIGHINVVPNGKRCGCGNNGCLEAYASGPAIVRRYQEKSHNYSSTITAKSIAEAARGGDKLSLEIYKKTGLYLGKAISYAVNLLNPEKVIMGGGVSMSIDLFLPEIKEEVNRTIFINSNKELSIERTALSYNAALIGAAAVAKLRIERRLAWKNL